MKNVDAFTLAYDTRQPQHVPTLHTNPRCRWLNGRTPFRVRVEPVSRPPDRSERTERLRSGCYYCANHRGYRIVSPI